MAEGNLESNEKGTTARANAGKTEFHLIPLHLLEGTADVLDYGRKKYAEWNWTKGAKWSSPFNSALRHLSRWFWLGEDIDAESGKHHLDHVIANLIFLRHYSMNYKDGDNRPGTSFNGSK